MKYFSLFSGIGGFELGIEQADSEYRGDNCFTAGMSNWKSECVGYSEIDKYAIQVYEKHFKHKNYGDITKINAAELPDFDFLCGGFPCQAFSIAGKRRGFDDTRGTLFFDIARILKEKKPRLLLLENVKGLLSHDSGRTFKTIITTLAELGYSVEWQVLNSKNFGVPQNRERVFIIGYFGGIPEPKVFPIRESNSNHIVKIKFGRHQQDCLIEIEGIAPTVSSYESHGAGYSHDNLISDGDYSIRRLTPKECERLQGFPDGWTEGISDTQRYKCLGNAITVNVIREIVNPPILKTYE